MANFCLATGVQPGEYKQLTQVEREAFRAEANRMAAEARSRRR